MNERQIMIEIQRERAAAAEKNSAGVGLAVLRTALLINAGAIVALLALIAQLWRPDTVSVALVLSQTSWFFGGLSSALAASLSAYWFADLRSLEEDRRLYRLLTDEAAGPVDPDAEAAGPDYVAVSVALFVLGSYIAFAVGAWRVFAALSQ